VDDNGKPWWVITEYKPSIAFWGEEILGVIILDPENGSHTRCTSDEIPEWVDRVMPETVAYDRMNWWGSLVHGWWNSVWAEEDVRVPTTRPTASDQSNSTNTSSKSAPESTKEKLWLIWDDQGNASWFTGFTSSKSSDQSLVGIGLMNARTGDMRYFRLSGSDEFAVIEAVNAEVSNYSNWHATQPIPYNIYGDLTWVVPVISDAGIFQKLALVRASTAEVVLGDTKKEALAEYRKLLQRNGSSVAPSTTSSSEITIGPIDRITPVSESGDTTFYVVLEGEEEGMIFTGTVMVSPELGIAREGDPVKITYNETSEAVVPMEAFDLLGFGSRISNEQARFNELEDARTHERETRKNAHGIRAHIENLSDEELLDTFGDE
jgi:hypothetical protein